MVALRLVGALEVAMSWFNLLIGQPEDPEDSADPVNLAEGYAMTRDMRPGVSSTLPKADRARRIALGLRRRSYAEPKGHPSMRALLPPARRHLPTRPHLVRAPMMAAFTNEAGERMRFPYLHTIDRSRYPPEKLRELRRTRR
jgi:hypothetical protein